MKQTAILLTIILTFSAGKLSAGAYDPKADAKKDIAEAVAKAKQENKYVFITVGGNWCRWCVLFDRFSHTNDTIRQIIDSNFIVVKVSYGEGNRNEDVLKMLDYPQRFGFPVFVILNEKGERIHTQNTAYLEQGKAYSTKKVAEFLTQWSKKTIAQSGGKK